jgi:hypothetical protein
VDLRESNDPHFSDLREALKNNPILVVENISVVLSYLLKGGYIYPSAQDDNLIPLVQGHCNLYYFSKGIYLCCGWHFLRVEISD